MQCCDEDIIAIHKLLLCMLEHDWILQPLNNTSNESVITTRGFSVEQQSLHAKKPQTNTDSHRDPGTVGTDHVCVTSSLCE